MTRTDKAIGYADLAIEAFLTAWLSIFVGSKAWEGYPSSTDARKVLDERRRKRRVPQ